MLHRLICSLVLAVTLVRSFPIFEVDERDSGFRGFNPGQLDAVSSSSHHFYTVVPSASHPVPAPRDTYTTAETQTTTTISLPSSRTVSPLIASHNSTSSYLPGISTPTVASLSPSQGTVINTDYGNFRGKPADKGAEAWLGVPFAQVCCLSPGRRSKKGARCS